jgi:hypothetical protein
MNGDFYGYKHWTLEDPPRCFNVGKGRKKRPFDQHHKRRSHKWHAIVKRLGLRVEVCVGPMEHFDACAWEIAQIAAMGTFSTNHSHDDPIDIGCNFTLGGEGSYGMKHTPEWCAKHSAILTGRKRPVRSAEWCANISVAFKGKKKSPRTVEHNANNAAARRGRQQRSPPWNKGLKLKDRKRQ